MMMGNCLKFEKFAPSPFSEFCKGGQKQCDNWLWMSTVNCLITLVFVLTNCRWFYATNFAVFFSLAIFFFRLHLIMSDKIICIFFIFSGSRWDRIQYYKYCVTLNYFPLEFAINNAEYKTTNVTEKKKSREEKKEYSLCLQGSDENFRDILIESEDNDNKMTLPSIRTM